MSRPKMSYNGTWFSFNDRFPILKFTDPTRAISDNIMVTDGYKVTSGQILLWNKTTLSIPSLNYGRGGGGKEFVKATHWCFMPHLPTPNYEYKYAVFFKTSSKELWIQSDIYLNKYPTSYEYSKICDEHNWYRIEVRETRHLYYSHKN